MRVRTTKWAALLAIPLLTVAATACNDDTVGPEDTITFETSFEEGLAGFMATSDGNTTPNSAYSVSVGDAVAAEGDQSLEMTVNNDGTATIWVERPMLELEGSTAYSLDVTFDFATQDTPNDEDWVLFVDALPQSPTFWTDFETALTEDTRVDEANESGLTWDEERIVVNGETGTDGMLHFAIGIRATTDDQRTYYIDDLSVTATEITSL